MTTLEFNTEIKATPEKVWQVLWDDATYREWTSPFSEGSYAVSNWNEGDSVHFLSPSGDGMNCIIDKKIDNKYIAFKFVGELKNFKEVPVDEKAKEWIGGMETYELTQNGDITLLKAKVDMVENHKEYFDTTFPKALEKVKQLSEK